MAEERAVPGLVRPVPRVNSPQYREREDLARIERHQRAALEAAGLFQAAATESPAERPIWVRAVILLMDALGADYATVTAVRGEEGRRCRITRGCGLTDRTSRRLPRQAQQTNAAERVPTRVDIDALSPATPPTATSHEPVPGAASSFHALLYVSGSTDPLGCLSLYSGRDLALAADRVALIHAVAGLLARELTGAPLPAPLSI